MASSAAEFFDSIAGEKKKSPPASTTASFFEDIATGKEAPTPEKPKGRDLVSRAASGVKDWYSASPAMGIPELLGQGVTGLAGKAIGGLAGLGTAAANVAGFSDASPADVVKRTQDALTYQPRSSSAEMLSSGLDKALHVADPLMLPVEQRLDEINPEIVPTIAAAGEAALDIAPMAAGLKAARGASRQVAPTESPSAPMHGEVNPFDRESMGAAAARPDLKNLSPELQAEIQKQAYRGGVDRASLERHVEADTLPIRMNLTKGQATQDPVQLSQEMNRRAKDPELARIFNEQNQQLIDNLDEIRARAAPNAVGNDHIQNGQALIDSYKAMDEPIRAEIAKKYKALEDANGGQFPLDGKSFVEAADKALAKKMKGRYVPSQVAGDLAELRDGGPMTFETFENLRTNLAAEARKAERSGDGNAAMAVNIVRESLESLPITGAAAEIKPLADAARSAAKARFDRLRADPAYRAAADDSVGIGEASPLADDFINKYVVKGKGANVKQMRENLADDPFAAETIAAGALNYVKSKSGVNLYTNEGNFSQAGYNRALAEITPKINALVDPKLAEQAQTLGNVARYTQAQPRGSFVNNSNTFTATLGEHAAGVAEGVANVAAHGVPVGTFVRKKLGERSDKKFVKEATKPGAGIELRELLKKPRK